MVFLNSYQRTEITSLFIILSVTEDEAFCKLSMNHVAVW
ncbi:uncharacterized protein METZ01_LOCUS218301 [marine metagenome]|uniref:Uncharacterized protein n=1 Tax=marine metagenome TaxID=408172 RepID=A0A382FTF9_9ZZZZ